MEPTPTTETAADQQLTVRQLLDLARQATVRYRAMEDACDWVLGRIADGSQPVAELLGTNLPNGDEWTRSTG